MKLPTLYSRASTGALREWTIETNETGYRTHSGVVGGKITTSTWYTVSATNVGRANERTIPEQAVFEAQVRWQKHIDSGYVQDPKDVDNGPSFVEPMLAKKWEDRRDKVSYPVFSQPKLDGMRAIITKDGARTRNGKSWVTIPHILEELAPLFADQPSLILDGELYNHEYKDDFNKICSLAKKTKPTPADLAESAEKLQFHWYDICDSNIDFVSRSTLITLLRSKYALGDCIKVVPTYRHENEESLDASYGEYMDAGYEGQMVRLNECYEFRRSTSLLKRKEFQDGEYRIIDICEGNGNRTSMAGYMILERDDGVSFRSNIKGNHDFLKDLLVHADKYIGTYATCTYFNLTPDGIPRFPYVTRLRAGQGKDL